MGQDLLEQGKFPTYFTGQSYGLSTIEALISSVAIFLFGLKDWGIKLGALTIWITGCIFFYKSLVNLNQEKKTTALILTLILTTCPTWIFWALKMRGGYLSAFLLSNILLYWITKKPQNWKFRQGLIIGVSLTLISQFQQLWLLGIIAILAYYILSHKQYKSLIPITLGAIIGLIPFLILKSQQRIVWDPNLLQPFDSFIIW